MISVPKLIIGYCRHPFQVLVRTVGFKARPDWTTTVDKILLYRCIRPEVVGSLSVYRKEVLDKESWTCRPWIPDSASLEESGGYLGLRAGEEQHFSRRRAGNVRLKCRGDLAPDKAILLADHVTWPRTRRRARPGRLYLETESLYVMQLIAQRRPSVLLRLLPLTYNSLLALC